jgi:hypothetical protein
MKFIYVKNLVKGKICNKLFLYLLRSKHKNKDDTNGLIKDLKNACKHILLSDKSFQNLVSLKYCLLSINR